MLRGSPSGKSKKNLGAKKTKVSNKTMVTANTPTTVPPPALSPESLAMSSGLYRNWVKYLRTQVDVYQILMTYEVAATSDGAGTLNQVFGNSPVTTLGWTSFSAVFDEYRCLGCTLEFHPLEFNGTAIVQAPIATVSDYDSISALTSYNSGAYFGSYREHAGGRGFKTEVLMNGSEDSGFIDVGAPVNSFCIKTYSSGNTVSTILGRWVFVYLLQFRGKGI